MFHAQTKEKQNPREKEVKKKDIFVLVSCGGETLPLFSSNIVLIVLDRIPSQWLLNKLRPELEKKVAGLGTKGLQRYLNWILKAMKSLKRSQGDTWYHHGTGRLDPKGKLWSDVASCSRRDLHKNWWRIIQLVASVSTSPKGRWLISFPGDVDPGRISETKVVTYETLQDSKCGRW